MGTVTRGTKAAGGTSFSDNTSARADEVNTDFDNIYSEFNGNIDEDNVKAAAGIDPTKIDDFSATAAEAATTTDPGVSGAASLATDLSDELERLRYAVQRLAIGNATVSRVDASGTTTAYWGDLPVIGGNRQINPDFQFEEATTTTVPVGWTANGGVTVSGAGGGNIVVTTANAATDYLSHTILDPPASARILVGVFMRGGTANATLSTSGADATSEFRDITLTETGTDTSTAVFRYAIVESDSSGTAIELRLGTATVGNASFHFVGWWAMGPSLFSGSSVTVHEDTTTSTQSITTSEADIGALLVACNRQTWPFAGVLNQGQFTSRVIDIRATITIFATSAEDVVLQISSTVNGLIGPRVGVSIAAGDAQTVHLSATEIVTDDTQHSYVVRVLGANGSAATINGTFAGETLESNLIAYCHNVGG